MKLHPAKVTSVFCVLLCCSLLPNCGSGGSMSHTPTLSRIVISAASKSIPKGTNLALTAAGVYSDGSQKNLTTAVAWGSFPLTIATVNAQGSLAGLGVGVAQVSAQYQGLMGNASITISPAALVSIAISGPEPTLPQGETEPLTAMGTFTDGTTQNLTSLATWHAGPANIASVSASGVLKGLGQGGAAVSAAYQSVTGSASVTIGTGALVSISVSAPRSTLPLGESEVMIATGNYSDGTTQNLTPQVSWKTNPASVAGITPQGSLTGLAQGITQVSAAYQGMNGAAAVSVGSAALLRLDVSPGQSSLPLGESEPLVATGTFSDGTVQNLSHVATWNSSQSSVASVNTTGGVAGKAQGSATITANIGAISGNASLTVTAPVIVGVSVNPTQSSLVIGSVGQLQAIAAFSDGSTQDVSATAAWTSEEPAVVGIAAGGFVSAEQVGTATIEAAQSGFTGTGTLTVAPMMLIGYFNRTNAANSKFDGTVRIVNPGYTPEDMCAMIYVFDSNEEMNACCGCVISDSGLLTLSLLNDITGNTLTGPKPAAGSIDIVPANLGANGQCNAGTPSPNSMLASWETNVQGPSAFYQVTEIPSGVQPLSPIEQQVLSTECGMIQTLGSGTGICSCGTGD
jgi:Big-like domain-containing protein